jgi:hypothetical protein
MIREEEKQRVLDDIDASIEFRTQEIAELKRLKVNHAKLVTFEETLEGMIETEELEAQSKVNAILHKLTESTGRHYTEFHVNTIDICDDFPVDEENPIQYEGTQRNAVEQLLDFCRDHTWNNERAMKKWIHKVVDES